MNQIRGKDMNQIEKEMYKLIYSPLITPKNLVENIYLENYESIKFIKTNGRIVCELHCTLPHGEIALFTYFFADNDFLEKIQKQLPGREPEIVFDRKEKMESLSSRFYKKRKTKRAV